MIETVLNCEFGFSSTMSNLNSGLCFRSVFTVIVSPCVRHTKSLNLISKLDSERNLQCSWIGQVDESCLVRPDLEEGRGRDARHQEDVDQLFFHQLHVHEYLDEASLPSSAG